MKIKVIKIGGKLIENSDVLASLSDSLAALDEAFVLVHGGGVMGSQLAEQLGVEVKMHEGRRITDSATLDIAVMAYAGLANKRVVAALQARGVNACGLSGCDMAVVKSHRRPVKDIDWGFVGDVDEVNAEFLGKLISEGVVPVMAPLTHDKQGHLLNTNADTIAGETAKALARLFDVTLIFCFEKKGVLRDENDDDSVIPHITRADFDALVADGTIQGGMIPKLENSFQAIDAGVSRVIITQASAIDGTQGTTIC